MQSRYLLLTAMLLSGCATTLEKLEAVGKAPPLSTVENPTREPNYEPLSWPMPEAKAPGKQYANSLRQPGARTFYRDQRAARVGDILRVNVNIQDKAEVKNETERKRDTTDTGNATSFLGVQNKLFGYLPGKAIPSDLLDAASKTNTKGTGNMKREEKITTQVAALVTQILPNGNLVIEGKQEMRVNYDIREISVRGVVRPEDIRADNSVDSTQIAEARIVYGGRGQIMDVQQPRWGSQAADVLLPF